jgi:hypothetical protein
VRLRSFGTVFIPFSPPFPARNSASARQTRPPLSLLLMVIEALDLQTTSYKTLPPELLIQVLQHVDLRSLLPLALASRTLYDLAEPYLYSVLSSHPEDDYHLTSSQAAGFLRSLLLPRCAVVGRRSRTFYLRVLRISLRDWAKPQFLFLRAFVKLIAATLSRCPNIIELHLMDMQHRDAWVLDQCISRPRIFATTFPPSPHLQNFLFNKASPQTQLEDLVLANRFSTYWNAKFALPTPLPVEEWTLPRLRSLHARSDIMEMLAPGRPLGGAVYDFTLDAYDDPPTAWPALREALAKTSGPLSRLGIQIRAGPRDNVIWSDCPLFCDIRDSPLRSITILDLHVPTFYYFKVLFILTAWLRVCTNMCHPLSRHSTSCPTFLYLFPT